MQIRHATVALALAAAIVAAVQAQAAPSTDSHARDSRSACESERLSAWFDRQRQITDGDVDPREPIATPAACAARADAVMQPERQAVSDAVRERAVPRATVGARG